MKGSITIKYLQEYIKSKDNSQDLTHYFMRLTEEMGELSKALIKNPPPATEERIKGTIEEELWDVMYYVLVLANLYDIDIEKWIPLKEKISNEKHNNNNIEFSPY